MLEMYGHLGLVILRENRVENITQAKQAMWYTTVIASHFLPCILNQE
jgi:hypothetical protein